MPAGNGTGPFGGGPMTGRAAGYCAGYSVPGYMNPIPGRGYGYGYGGGYGFGRGRGRGFGFSRGFGRGGGRGYRASIAPYAYPAAPIYPALPAQMAPEDEVRLIEDDIKYLKGDLKAMEERLSELKKKEK